jgi:hypothetical protein
MSYVTDAPRSARVGSLRPLFPDREDDDLTGHAIRQLIGYLGFALPPLFWLIAGWRPTMPLERWKLLDSLSAYYYTSAVVLQVGILSTLAIYLFTYKGYKNEHRRGDQVAAIIAASAALLVALFPTAAPHPSLKLGWWTAWTGRIHYAAAVVQFVGFIVFALVLFPKSNPKSKDMHGKLPRGKRVRNGIYRFCGWGIVACVVWAAIAAYANKSIFWPETGAVELFAISWLAKGRAEWTIKTASTRTIHYIRNPQQLVNVGRSAIRS